MDPTYVDKRANDKNGVKYLLVRQDLFDGTVDTEGMKTKDSKKTVGAFLTMITKKNRPKKFSVDKGTEFGGVFEKKLQNWEKIILMYKDWDWGCICWTYNTILDKYIS